MVISPDRAITRDMLGHDFMAFYTAGTFVRQGRIADLYHLPSVREYQHELARHEGFEMNGSFGPWWNPPFYALVFRPLAGLPFTTAQQVWGAANLLCLAAALTILCRILIARPRPIGLSPEQAYEARLCPQDAPPATWRTWLLVPLLVIASSPCLQAFSHCQNTFSSLLILAAAVAAWRGRRPVLAGMVAGLLFYKPQLGAIVALALVLDQGWRAVLGLALTGLALLAVSVYTLPGATEDFLARLAANVRFMQVENAYLWERHVTWKAFWRLLQSRQAGEATLLVQFLTVLSTAGFALALLACAWLGRKVSIDVRTDRRIAATIAAMPLLMPFYFDYDALLLAIPAVLFAAELRSRLYRLGRRTAIPKLEGWLIRLWGLTYLYMFINPGLGRITHVNLTVPLMAGVSALLIARLRRPETPAATTSTTAPAPRLAA